MMKKRGLITTIGILGAVMCLTCGCTKKVDYSDEYNYETDCQYSYATDVDSWKKIQSDGSNQYILKDNFIYYYSTESGQMTPLCDNVNCLHDQETEQSRITACNAYAPTKNILGYEYIQYYDGNIYFVSENSLYRVSKDGGKKDIVFTTDFTADDEEVPVNAWLIHRGYFYYETETYYYGEDEDTQIYTKCSLKSIKLSSKMSEKKAQVIFESDEEHSVLNLGGLKAYKNYLFYNVIANQNDFEMTDNESWIKQLYYNVYMFNIETGRNEIIPVPEGYSETTKISTIAFLKDKMVFKIYDDLEDEEYQLPIYSINYDLTNEQIWLDNVEQGKCILSYGDYVILSDADIQYFVKDNKESCNIEIYQSDATKVSSFTYPFNSMSFGGFGPDGVNVEFKDGKDSWQVYELKFEDVLNCQGEEVKLELVGERKYGLMHQGD